MQQQPGLVVKLILVHRTQPSYNITMVSLQPSPCRVAASAFMVKLVQVYCTKLPVTKQVPHDVHTQCCKRSQPSYNHAKSLFIEHGVRGHESMG